MKRHLFTIALLISASCTAALAQPGVPVQAQQTSQQQLRQQQQSQQRIYGSQLMTPQERMAFRERMRNAKTVEERNRIRAEHHKQMQERAKARGITLPDMPPAGGGRMQRRNSGGGGQGGRGQGMRQGGGGS